ncbi:efflux transporter outer membrane subunit [Novosphingobium sp.]|uniref:efflux transporter outer membrane subunit n=1 Tax=Novosphingobium sp. TaxID=1874826 RepID=UPI0025E1265F|nr:efflux transporter outer membrane subunit [Novosphingobium sp.]
MTRLPTAALSAVLLLAACTPGPRDVRGSAPLPPARASETIAPASGPAQAIEAGAEPLPRWWESFGSARLKALVDVALAHNNDLAMAEATLRQAREQAAAVAGSQGPQVDASLQSQRLRVSQTFSPPLPDPNAYIYTLHTAQLTVSYPIDMFGAGRSKVRSARAAADVAAARLVAARTTIVANLALAVIQHASLEAQIAATHDAVESDRQLVTLLERRRAIGDLGEADVIAQKAALAAIEATLPGLERQAEHQLGLIDSLTGVPAGSPPPDLPLMADLALPAGLPLGLPADIIAHRPDVRAAEAQLRGAAADLGTAIAARLPALQLTGNIGGSANRIEDLFATGNPFFAVIGTLTQPIFHSRQLLHQQRASAAALDAAKAQYRSAALQAFLDVDDALAGLRTDAAALDAASRANAAASRSFSLTRRQVELGALGTTALLNASVAASQATALLVQAQAARLSDSVALFQATGTNLVIQSKED